jgi:hypothetical protein
MVDENEVSQRVLLERRMTIGADSAKVTRDGEHIKIVYGYAGRLTREDDRFYADDIRKLARFVIDTDPKDEPMDDPELDELLRESGCRVDAERAALKRRERLHWAGIAILTAIVLVLQFFLPGGLFNG